VTAARRGQRVIVVVLDSTTRQIRDAKAAQLTAKGFALLSGPATVPAPARKMAR
jgi:D-alanyl-D-alanine carboxypeptidase